MAMQQNKGIVNISTIGNNGEKNAVDIFHTLKIMKVARIGQFFNGVKRCGVNVPDIILLLVLMPFYHLKSVPMLLKSGLGADHGVGCGNSIFYDLKNNPKINWRSLLYLVALRFKNLADGINTGLLNSVRAFIFDDSPPAKERHQNRIGKPCTRPCQWRFHFWAQNFGYGILGRVKFLPP